MRKEYEEELRELRERMEDAESFSRKLPYFEDHIIINKLTGREEYIQFGNEYKGMPLGWGINRGRYRSGTSRRVSNYLPKSSYYDEYLFRIYINTLNLYDSYQNHGLEDILKKVDVFFYDKLNTTFYATDDEIIPLLEALSQWYPKAKIAASDERIAKKKAKLLAQQERIEAQLQQL